MLILDSGMSLGDPEQSPLSQELLSSPSLLPVLPSVAMRPHEAMKPYRNTISTMGIYAKGWEYGPAVQRTVCQTHSHAHTMTCSMLSPLAPIQDQAIRQAVLSFRC